MVNMITMSSLGLRSTSIILGLFIPLSFMHSISAYALPTEAEQESQSRTQSDLIALGALNPDDWPPEDILFEWSPTGPRLDNPDTAALYLTALYCSEIFTVRPSGTQITIPRQGQLCAPLHVGSVQILIQGMAASQDLSHIFSNHVVFAIYLGIGKLTLQSVYSKLTVKLRYDNSIVASVTFEPPTAESSLEKANNGSTVIASTPDGVTDLGIGAVNVGKHVCQADTVGIPHITYKIKLTGERGLTIQP